MSEEKSQEHSHAEHHEHHAEHNSEQEQKARISIKKPILNLIAVGILFLVIGLVVGYFALPKTGMAIVPTGTGSNAVDSGVVSQKVADYVNTNFLSSRGMECKIAGISDFSDYLYEIKLDLYQNGEKLQDTTVFATKDGKTLVLGTSNSNVFNLDAPLPTQNNQQEQQQPAASLKCEDVTKAETAKLEAFVVAFCPYGLQAQRVLAPVAKLMPENVIIRYIGSVENGKITAMHGDAEATENLRQICIREEQSDKYWPYVECEIKVQNSSEACLVEAKVDKAKLDACTTDPQKGLKYAQVDFDLASKYGVGGSPTLILNGETVSEFSFATGAGLSSSQARSADNVKNLICCGFNTKPGACTTELAKDGAATSFSTTYSAASGSSTTAASCG